MKSVQNPRRTATITSKAVPDDERQDRGPPGNHPAWSRTMAPDRRNAPLAQGKRMAPV
jgi:hypothetical protein